MLVGYAHEWTVHKNLERFRHQRFLRPTWEMGDFPGFPCRQDASRPQPIRQGADEFITSELPGKPVFRVRGIKVVSLHSL